MKSEGEKSYEKASGLCFRLAVLVALLLLVIVSWMKIQRVGVNDGASPVGSDSFVTGYRDASQGNAHYLKEISAEKISRTLSDYVSTESEESRHPAIPRFTLTCTDTSNVVRAVGDSADKIVMIEASGYLEPLKAVCPRLAILASPTSERDLLKEAVLDGLDTTERCRVITVNGIHMIVTKGQKITFNIISADR